MKAQISITPELSLRVMRPFEAGTLHSLVGRNREHLREWLPWVDEARSLLDARHFLERSYIGFLRGAGFNFGIRLDGALIGLLGYHGFDHANRVTSMGYWLGSEFCGRGIMRKCAAHGIEYAFTERNMNRLSIRCAVENVRSKRIPESLGMVMEGTQREAEWLYDRFVDLDTYSILASEWDSSILDRL